MQLYIMCGRIDAWLVEYVHLNVYNVTLECGCALLYTRLRLRASSQALTIHVAKNYVVEAFSAIILLQKRAATAELQCQTRRVKHGMLR